MESRFCPTEKVRSLFIKYRKSSGKVALILGSVALACAVLVNVIFGLIPSSYSKYDLTSTKMYTLSAQTKRLVREIDKDVNIYLLSYEGEEDPFFYMILERYANLNRHIKLKRLDLESDLYKIATYTPTSLQSNSLIIESDERYRVIPYNELLAMSESAYNNAYEQYAYYYSSGYIEVSFYTFLNEYAVYAGLYDGYEYESQITSSLRYVTLENLKTVYYTTGHDETILPDYIQSMIATRNIELMSLNLSESDVPGDAAVVIILNPKRDITESELVRLQGYANGGGVVMVITSHTSDNTTFDNISAFCERFGLSTDGGALYEDNTDYNLNGSKGLLLPELKSNEITDDYDSKNLAVLIGGATGVTEIADLPDNIEITEILITSIGAYTKGGKASSSGGEELPGDGGETSGSNDPEKTTDYEEGDPRGLYYIGVLSENKDSGGRLIWYSSAAIADSDYDSYINGGNSALLVSSVAVLSGSEKNPDIPAIFSIREGLTVSDTGMYVGAILLVGVLPLSVIMSGGIYIYRRKKK